MIEVVAALLAFAPPSPSPNPNPNLARNIANLEYEAHPEGAGTLVAPNRAQGWRLAFSEAGAALRPRDPDVAKDRRFDLTLRLSAIGRALGKRTSVERVAPRLGRTASRIEYDHAQCFEWFENRTDGVEQSFRIGKRSVGDGLLQLVVSCDGSARPRSSADGVVLLASDGRAVARYQHLEAFDAKGASLPSEMRIDGDAIVLEIDDSDAAYPVTIDPLATAPDWSVEGNQINSELGYAVASAGDVNGDGFDDVIVGAPQFDAGQNNEGRAFLFLGSPSGPSTTPAWTAESNQASAFFGWSVASAGDVNGDGYGDVVVGAVFYDSGPADDGRAYVFLGSATGLSALPAWTADGGLTFAELGTSVAAAGDVNADGFGDVIVGAPNTPVGTMLLVGRAYAYHGGASGLSPVPAWTATGTQASGLYAYAVAGIGDTNADGYDDVALGNQTQNGVFTEEGTVDVFRGSSTGLQPNPAATFLGTQAIEWFGTSVAGAGDVQGDGFTDFVVGAVRYSNGQASEGAAFAYAGQLGALAPVAIWSVESNTPNAFYASRVAGGGDVNADGYDDILVGAQSLDSGVLTKAGRVDLFEGSALGPGTTAAWSASGTSKFQSFGTGVGLGDTNGDGFSDVLIGADNYTGDQASEGRAVAFFGGCDANASATPYGLGKAGTFGVPTLASIAPPKLGTTADLTLTNGLPNASSVVLLAGPLPSALAFDGGTILATPQFVVPLPPLDGAGTLGLPIPIVSLPALCGVHFYFQALFVDAGATGPYHTAQTNGLDWMLGS